MLKNSHNLARRLLLLGMALGISACTATATVPPANTGFIQSDQIPGKYAALVQTGGWAINAKIEGWNCGAWDFDTDVNPTYVAAMRDGLLRGVGQVVFVDAPLDPQGMKEGGYDAQIVIMQGGADGRVGMVPGFFSATSQAEVTLNAIMAVSDANGPVIQQPLSARGTAAGNVVWGCNEAAPAVGTAAKNAVELLVKDAVLYARDGIRKKRDRAFTTPEPAKPVS